MSTNYPIRDEYGDERKYLDDRNIVLIVGDNNMSNRSLDLWAGMMLDTLERSPDPVYTYLLLDLRPITQAFNAYSRVTVADIIQRIPAQRKLVVAIVVEQPVFHTITDVFLRRVDKALPNRFVFHNFSDVDAGIHWLRAERIRNNLQ